MRKIGIIGGGAAGFFAAIQCKLLNPETDVTILEKTSKVLAKVKISGGGRCNVTNVESDPVKLAIKYPRGERQLKKAFRNFSTTDTIRFFEERGVPLVAQEDGCIFPVSQDSQSIIDCFLNECNRLNIEVKKNFRLDKIEQVSNGGFTLIAENANLFFDKVIICTGGAPKKSHLLWLEELNQPVIDPVPSLFTFNMPGNPITELQGSVVKHAITKIPGTKLTAEGPLLITHWGMSGPAILVLSAWGARVLEEVGYEFKVTVNWTGIKNEEEIRTELKYCAEQNANKKLDKFGVFGLTQRLWSFLLDKFQVNKEKAWKELNKKEFNRLVNGLMNDEYPVSGKTTFKEEFVTAGGVDLSHVNVSNMESKIIPGLHFAGEILDIDGITGGFNFQAAWTTAYLAAKGAVS